MLYSISIHLRNILDFSEHDHFLSSTSAIVLKNLNKLYRYPLYRFKIMMHVFLAEFLFSEERSAECSYPSDSSLGILPMYPLGWIWHTVNTIKFLITQFWNDVIFRMTNFSWEHPFLIKNNQLYKTTLVEHQTVLLCTTLTRLENILSILQCLMIFSHHVHSRQMSELAVKANRFGYTANSDNKCHWFFSALLRASQITTEILHIF